MLEVSFPITALLLAGGKSNRMRVNKVFLPVQGSMLIKRVLCQLKPLFDEILLCVSSRKGYDFLNCPSVVDEKPLEGPLGAILSGLRASTNPVNFVIACDIPEINQEFLNRMARHAESFDIVVPVTGEGKYEPLFAFYNKRIIPVIENLLKRGHRKVNLLFSFCCTHYIWMHDQSWFFNLNTWEDFKKYKQYLFKTTWDNFLNNKQ